MFREMTKKKKQMSEKDTMDLLEKGSLGILGTISDNGYPYTVPVNYVYYNGKIYFHCAKKGHKIDNIMKNEKVSFTVVGHETIIQEEFTTDFSSIILFGIAKVVDPSKEILFELVKKYSMDFIPEGKEVINQDFHTASIVEIEIVHITGKASK